ncbi:MAG: hypothetical protein MJZ57_06260, partial [Bacteroidales bacterium]|nr:hypothetical protein [Bacteroidales bacterium]
MTFDLDIDLFGVPIILNYKFSIHNYQLWAATADAFFGARQPAPLLPHLAISPSGCDLHCVAVL